MKNEKRHLSAARCDQAANQTEMRLCFHIILCRKQVFSSHGGRRRCLVVEHRTPEQEVGFDPHSGGRVVSFSKMHSPPKCTGNT